jgi:hypothetical protein
VSQIRQRTAQVSDVHTLAAAVRITTVAQQADGQRAIETIRQHVWHDILIFVLKQAISL